jgi:hypothetical protein
VDWKNIAFGVLLLLIGVGALLGYLRRNRRRPAVPVIAGPPRRQVTLASALAPAAALARIRTVSAAGRLKIGVAADEPERGLVVLSDEASMKGYANFYPCFVGEDGKSGSEIVVGIVPPPPQMGPAVNGRLKKMAEAVRAALT